MPSDNLEGQVEILKAQLHNLELRLASLETDFPELRQKFAGFKGQMDSIQKEMPAMKAVFDEKIRGLIGINSKVKKLYDITVKQYNEKHPDARRT